MYLYILEVTGIVLDKNTLKHSYSTRTLGGFSLNSV